MAQPPTTQPQAREFLEVPFKSTIERRLDVAAQRPLSKPAIGELPRSALLDRLHSFLPAMQQANAQLETQLQDQPAESFDIEHLEGGEEAPHIEMDLSCGILDLRDEAALAAAEQQLAAGGGPDDALLAAAAEGSSSDSDCSEDYTLGREGGGNGAAAPGLNALGKGDAGGREGLSSGQQAMGSAADKRQKGKRQKPRKIQEL